jgi:hypothetical protein
LEEILEKDMTEETESWETEYENFLYNLDEKEISNA